MSKSLGEEALGFDVDSVDDFEKFGLRVDEIVVLVFEEIVAFLQFIELLDGVQIDWAHCVEAAFDIGDNGFHEFPIRFTSHLAGNFNVIGRAIDDHGRHVIIRIFLGFISSDDRLATAATLKSFLRSNTDEQGVGVWLEGG